jgi:hypothetical protein
MPSPVTGATIRIQEPAFAEEVAWGAQGAAPGERRRHQRVKVQLPGRFMRSDRREFDCVTIDMSPGGIALASDAEIRRGERIVAYLSQIGRLEGTVARTFAGGFAIEMKLTPVKRDKLADQLTWLANRDWLELTEDRRHDRISPRDPRTVIKLANGSDLTASLIDLSMSGAAIAVDTQPAIGERVLVGSTPAQIVRHIESGVAVEFARKIPPEHFNDRIVL